MPSSPHRQAPIRRTLAILLTIPVVALAALWAYAAFTTIGPYIAQRNGQTDNNRIGASSSAFLAQLTQERSDTLAWQAEHGPRDALAAQRAKTDQSVTAFEAGLAQTTGIGGAAAKSAAATLEQQIGQLTSIRTRVDAGQLPPLTAFADYNAITDAYFSYIRTQLVSGTSVPLFQQGQAVIASGQALEELGREAAVVGGALAGGGRMTTAEYRQFVLALDQQRFLMQTINSPESWQLTANPFASFYASQSYQQFAALEDQIADDGAGAEVPVPAATWQSEVGSTLKSYGDTELNASTEITASSAHVGGVILWRLIIVGGAGLAAVIIVGFLMLRFGNRISRELTTFNDTVRSVAEDRLPSVMRRLNDGQDVDVDTEAPPVTLDTRTQEVARIAEGFSEVQRTAVAAAVGQADLRKGISNIFRSLARRNQTLLQRQLRMLEEMERGTEDPDALTQLFRLDHLTTRMRRQSEGLIILSGAVPGRRWNEPVPIIEVLRGATGEVEDYVRVDLATESDDLVAGSAVADLTHLLAELIENAAQYSPPSTRVLVKTGWGASGFIVEIEDRGLGIPAATMAELNQRLAEPPEFDLADSDQLGLIVVSRLAQRHGIRVTLRSSPYGGAAAIVLIPKELVVQASMAAYQANGPRAALSRSGDQGPQAIPVTYPEQSRYPDQSRYPEPFTDDTEVYPEVRTQPAMPSYTPLPTRTATGAISPGALPPADRVPEPRDPDPDSGGTHNGLPRRTRQASLAPQLREAPPSRRGPQVAAQAAEISEEQAAQSAERARSLISSVQQGWRSGRADADRQNTDRQNNDRGHQDHGNHAGGPVRDDQPGPEGGNR